MKLKKILKDKIIIFPLLFSVFLFLINLYVNYFLFYPVVKEKPFAVLHYNIFFGIDYLQSPQYIFVFSAFSLIVLLINILLVVFLYHRNRFLSRMLNAYMPVLLCIILGAHYLMYFFNR